MVTYKEILKYIKILDDNYDFLDKLRNVNLYHENYTFDFYSTGKNIDVDCMEDYGTRTGSLEIFLDSKKEGLMDFHFGSYRIDIKSEFIRNLSYEEIDNIDEIEYTLRRGRITTFREDYIKAIPFLIEKYLERIKQDEL